MSTSSIPVKMDETGDEDWEVLTGNLRSAVERNFDHEAALCATPEQSRDMLKVFKHYIRAINGSNAVNKDLKVLLTSCAIEPSLPGSVVGGFPFLLKVLQTAHQCTGRDCVLRLREEKKKEQEKTSNKRGVDRDRKGSVKKPGKTVKSNSGSSKGKGKKNASKGVSKTEKKDMPNYFI